MMWLFLSHVHKLTSTHLGYWLRQSHLHVVLICKALAVMHGLLASFTDFGRHPSSCSIGKVCKACMILRCTLEESNSIQDDVAMPKFMCIVSTMHGGYNAVGSDKQMPSFKSTVYWTRDAVRMYTWSIHVPSLHDTAYIKLGKQWIYYPSREDMITPVLKLGGKRFRFKFGCFRTIFT